jgi:hypothetical protein
VTRMAIMTRAVMTMMLIRGMMMIPPSPYAPRPLPGLAAPHYPECGCMCVRVR